MFNLMAEGYPPKGSKFVVLYNDGSGADMIMRLDSGEYIGCAGEDFTDENLDNYLFWALVPEGFEFWYEANNK